MYSLQSFHWDLWINSINYQYSITHLRETTMWRPINPQMKNKSVLLHIKKSLIFLPPGRIASLRSEIVLYSHLKTRIIIHHPTKTPLPLQRRHVRWWWWWRRLMQIIQNENCLYTDGYNTSNHNIVFDVDAREAWNFWVSANNLKVCFPKKHR